MILKLYTYGHMSGTLKLLLKTETKLLAAY